MAALAVLPGIAAAGSALTGQEAVLEQLVVHVNGDPLTKTDIDERLRVTRALNPGVPTGSPGGDAALLLPRILRDAVDELLMVQRARDLGLAVADEDVARVIAKVRADSRAETEEAFQELLQADGITLAGLQTAVRRQLLIENVKQRVFGRVSVSNDEAQREFDRQQAGAKPDQTVTFRQLCFRVPPYGTVDDTERDRALVRVVAAGDKLTSGRDFAEVVREAPDGSPTDAGGVVGPVGVSTLEPQVRRGLAGLRPGETSGPIATAAGYCFLKLEAERPAGPPSFRERRDALMQRLLAEKQQAALQALLIRLRSSAIFQWKRADLRALYER